MKFDTVRQYSAPTWILLIIHLPVAWLATTVVAIASEALALPTRLLPIPTVRLDRIQGSALPFFLFCGLVGALLVAWIVPSMARSGRWAFLPVFALSLPECLSDYHYVYASAGSRLDRLIAFVFDDDWMLVALVYLSYSLGMFWVVRRNPRGLQDGDLE